MKKIANINQNGDHYDVVLQAVKDFFDGKAATAHLCYLDQLMDKIFTDQQHKWPNDPNNLFNFFERLGHLFETCASISLPTHRRFAKIVGIKQLQNELSLNEKQNLSFYPYYLRQKELIEPVRVFETIFNLHDLSFYKKLLYDWLVVSIAPNIEAKNDPDIVLIYSNAKKLISAAWLIHERLVSKKSYQMPYFNDAITDFALCCPLLLTDEDVTQPYNTIESFFSFTSLADYRKELHTWYRYALADDTCYEQAATLIFIHNQFIRLINAGLLIVRYNIPYQPKPNYASHSETFGHWLLNVNQNQIAEGIISAIDAEAQTLDLANRKDPLAYCKQLLSVNGIKELRYGLKEWLEAALSKNSSISILAHEYQFDFYEKLQKLMEAFYLIITASARKDVKGATACPICYN